MMSRYITMILGVVGLALIGAMALLAADAPSGSQPVERFLAHASTDKPIYRAGERVYVRAVIMDADNQKPWSPNQRGVAQVQIIGPKGEILTTNNASILDSIAGFSWAVPPTASGGQYKAVLRFPALGFPPAERKFEVRAYRVPRLKGEIIFLRDGFGPGDTVKASLHVERAEGGIPAGATVAADALVDDASVFQGSTAIDAAGNCSVEFKLPAQLTHGDGTLSLSITDGGVVEPIAKTIPILFKTVDIVMYPEGGDLVAGLPNRVYLEARTPAKKPADIVGSIVDPSGQEVAAVRTEHEGRGRFIFTPRADQTYTLKLSQPAGIDKAFALPMVKPAGVVIMSGGDVTDNSQPVSLKIAASTAAIYVVELRKHDNLLSTHTLKLGAGEAAAVEMDAPPWADGVLTATVKGDQGVPLAERLVFRRPQQSLHVQIKSDKSSYVPADGVELTIATTDDAGKPVGAEVGITATDASVLQMLEKRDHAPRLNEMALLEDDVRDLDDADVYLDPANPKSQLATDLLLGTQGWRRFASVDEAKFIAQYTDAARRALADRQPPLAVALRGARGGGAGGGRGGGVGGAGAPGIGAAPPEGAARDGAVVNGAESDVLKRLQMKRRLEVGDQDIVAAPPAQDALQPAGEAAPGGRGGRGGAAGRGLVALAPAVRIYAHDLRPDHQPGQRNDFTETLYWSAGVKTDPSTGLATVSFKLNDSVTSFKVSADAFSADGALGEGTAMITSVQPFYLEPKLPLEVTTGDVIRLPIAAVNGTTDPLPVSLIVDTDPALSSTPISAFSLQPGGRDRRVSQITVGQLPALPSVRIIGQAGAYADQVSRQLVVKPKGFPIQVAHGGMLEPNANVIHAVEIPPSVVAGSIVTTVALYPTPVGNLTEALRGLMKEPNGCFEQTSSTTFPLVMADQYFVSHRGTDPKLVADSNTLLDKGYQRLIGFECTDKGYEWFGQNPGHECLTAYGLLEFTEMSAVRAVDPVMLRNTRDWLMARRDGKGGFTHERRAMHTWIADPDAANGYCTWALLEAGEKKLDPEVAWLKTAATNDPNSYVKGLAANALSLAGDHGGAKIFMDQLAHRQDEDGHVSGGTTTVVGSGGQSLEIETTSLATLAWLRDPAFSPNVEKAIRYLAAACQGGRYGSTQATVLALRAIVNYDKSRAHPTAAGKAQVFVDGNAIGDAMAFDASTQGALKLPDFAEKMTPGTHQVEVRMTDGSELPYAMEVAYNSQTPASSDRCKVSLSVALKDAEIAEGALTEANVTVTNRTDEAIPTPIAIIGLPGGLEVRYDQLKELVKAERIAAYETRGREVILYWRDLQPNQSVQIPLSLTAAVPGVYTGPASRAYQYYTDEFKQWAPGLKVTIREK